MPKFFARCRTMPVALVVALFALCLSAGSARAGTYDITSCNPDGSAAGWTAFGGPTYQATAACPLNGDLANRGLLVHNAVSIGAIGSSKGGLSFRAPAGTSVVGVGAGARIQRWDGAYWVGLVTGSGQPLFAFWANDGNGSTASGYTQQSWFAVNHENEVDVAMGCPSLCDTTFLPGTGVHALAQLFDPITVRIEDTGAPSETLTGGALVSGSYASGTQSLSFDASDPSGIRATRLYVDGHKVRDDARTCNFEQPVPCSNVSGGSYSVDTRALGDGPHEIKVETVDAAGNASTQSRSFVVDNSAPDAPDVEVSGGSGWRSTNNFDMRWTNPSGQTAPIAKAHYRICAADQPNDCQSAAVATGADISSIAGLHVPAEGDYTVSVWLEDAAGNTSDANASAPLHLRYDQTGPSPAGDVAVAGGEGWRSTSSFDVSWTNPADQLAPITAVRYRLCDESGSCTVDAREAGESRLGVVVPRAGEYTLTLSLCDEAGNVGGESAPVRLRFDDTDPGEALPAEHEGWLTTDTYDEQVGLADGTSRSLSGLAGFAVSIDGSEPGSTPEVGPAGVVHLDRLPEGRVVVRARAISNSGVASSHVGSATLLVDRSAPTVSVTGAPDPDRWQAEPVALTIHSEDQPELSGAAGGFVSYSIDGGPEQRVSGDTAHLSVADDGEHTIAYSASDLAGNRSEPRTVLFKLDGSAPGAAIPASSDGWVNVSGQYVEHVRISDPESVPESGLAGFSVTTDGSDPDETPETDASGDFPIEDLAEGVTTVKARAVSRAGIASTEVGTGTVKVDRSPPVVALERPGDSELAAQVADSLSGVKDGMLELRRAGASDWTPLVTDLRERLLAAPFDRRHLEPGSYELRANATDAAGNRRTVTTFADGAAATVIVEAKGVSEVAQAPVVSQPATSPAAPAHQVRCPVKAKRPVKRKRHQHSKKHKRHSHARQASRGCAQGGEKHRHRHLGRKTHKPARRTAG